MPINLPETGGGNVKCGSVSRMAGRIIAVKLGYVTGSFTNLATCWAEELRLVWEAIPRCMIQDISWQDLLAVFAALLQQQLGSAKRLKELPSSSEQCDILTRKPIEASKMATTKLR